MPQIFHRSANAVARGSIVLAVVAVVSLACVLYAIGESSYYTGVNEAKPQPVPFSHRHHAGELGIDCRYCHTSVEQSAFAGLPPTQTCMTCHSQIWTNSSMLEPVRASYRDNVSIEWTRLNALPDFVYFNHSIHISKGIGCTTCHGPIASMPLTWRANTLYMHWCLDCHRQPEKFIRPRSEVFNPLYVAPPNQLELGRKLVAEYKVKSVREITNCDTCHR